MIVIVGDVAVQRGTVDWFTRRPLFGTRVLVTRPAHQAAALRDPLEELGAEVIVQPAIEIGPPADWGPVLGNGIDPKTIWGFDPTTGKLRQWPLRFSIALWSLTLSGLRPGGYGLRVRTVDKNGFAQPQPRPVQQSGLNRIQCKQFIVMG